MRLQLHAWSVLSDAVRDLERNAPGRGLAVLAEGGSVTTRLIMKGSLKLPQDTLHRAAWGGESILVRV